MGLIGCTMLVSDQMLSEFDRAADASRNICFHLRLLRPDRVAFETSLASRYHAVLHQVTRDKDWACMEIELPEHKFVTQRYIDKLNIVKKTIPKGMRLSVSWSTVREIDGVCGSSNATPCYPVKTDEGEVFTLRSILSRHDVITHSH